MIIGMVVFGASETFFLRYVKEMKAQVCSFNDIELNFYFLN